MKTLVIIMGVAGSGKSSVAAALADETGWPFIEADDYHSPANKQKMAAGIPLTDADRGDWVRSMGDVAAGMEADSVVLACSALTPFVQKGLREYSARDCRFVFLDVPKEELARRIAARADHFMPVSLLESQLDALTVPEGATRVDGNAGLAETVAEIRRNLTIACPGGTARRPQR